MRELDLQVQCPELLQQVSGFPNDGKGTALPDILEEIEHNQSALRKAFGFAEEETTLERGISTDFDKQFAVSSNVIFSLLDSSVQDFVMTDMSVVWNNRLPSGTKVSKAIARRVADGSYIEGLGKYLITMPSDKFIVSLKSELPKYNISSSMDILKDPMVFVQNFFSEVAAAQNKNIGFTIDPLMFLRGCNSPNYSSCYKIAREYNSMSALSLGLNGMTGMIYLRDSASILGRCWVTFSPKFSSFCVLKAYGFLKESTVNTVCQWLCTILNKDATWYSTNFDIDPEWDEQDGPHLYPSVGHCGVYGDPIVKVYSSKIEDDRLSINSGLSVVTPKCILCGNRVRAAEVFCADCKKTRITKCRSCGNLMFVDHDHSVQLCSSCLSKVEVCPNCGKIKKKGETCTCSTTANPCVFCGNENTIRINNLSVCVDCAQAMMKDTCDVCGAHGVMYPLGKKALCFNCFSHTTAYRFVEEGNEELDEARRKLR